MDASPDRLDLPPLPPEGIDGVEGFARRIETTVDLLRDRLTVWARHMAARYNGPVYLLGSTLHHPSPRDTDIRVVVEDHEFAARYGQALHDFDPLPEFHPFKKRYPETAAARLCDFQADGPTQRWIDDMAKFTSGLSRRFGLNIDLQVVPESWWRDPYPAPVLLAAPSVRWWIYNRFHPDPATRQG